MVKRLSDIPFPPVLYKYRDWRNAHHRKLISKSEVYFAKPSDFNDPFDGNIPVRWDLMTYEECLVKNLELLAIVYKDADRDALRKAATRITDERTLWHPDSERKESDEAIAKWDSIMGLLSLTEVKNSILMWSHYSSLHTGFVVGLDTAALIEQCDFGYMEPIVYQADYPLISGMDDLDSQFHKKFFFKSNLWAYEHEWRGTKNHIRNRLVRLDRDTITEVIIGCRASEQQLAEMVAAVRRYLPSTTVISSARKNLESFSLSIEPLVRNK